MGLKVGNFLTNREHAPNRYISFIIASIYWCTDIPCVKRRDGPNQKNPAKYKFWIIDALYWFRIHWWCRGLSFRQYIDAGMLFMWIEKIHWNSCVWLEDIDHHSVRLACLLKNSLVFVPHRPEKEICVLNEKCKFRFQIKLDRHSQRPFWKIWYLPDPPLFSLFYTFKVKFDLT
jgi:hypothetical protein